MSIKLHVNLNNDVMTAGRSLTKNEICCGVSMILRIYKQFI